MSESRVSKNKRMLIRKGGITLDAELGVSSLSNKNVPVVGL